MNQPQQHMRPEWPATRAARRASARLTTVTAAALGACLIASAPAHAQGQGQAFPAKPIKLVVPFTPGGSTDVSSRLLAQEMVPVIGQPVIVENKPGNAGGIGTEFVAKSDPDGYTLGVSGVGPTILLNLTGQHTGYNTLRDLAFVSKQVMVETALVARKDFPANNVRELIAYAKANPGKVSFGNAGTSGPVHLANELFRAMAGIEGLEVPYKGDAPLAQDLMGGQVDVGGLSVPGATAALKSGAIKAIGMQGTKRSAAFPNVPTIDESGLPGYEAYVFQLIVAPIKTPAPVMAKLNEAVNKALATETIKAKYAELGMIPTGGTIKDATDFVQNETAKWKKVIDMIASKAKK